MFWVFRQLGTPTRYLAISQGAGFLQSKKMYDLVIPTVLSAGCTYLVVHLDLKLGMLDASGFTSGIVSLLNLLIAFFIAALAAVATFERKGLDGEMKGDPAVLKRLTSTNVNVDYPLSYRQFICYLFGYLSFISIVVFVLLSFLHVASVPLISAITQWGILFHVIRSVGIFVYLFFVFQILILMLLGIYFLTDRLQTLDDPGI